MYPEETLNEDLMMKTSSKLKKKRRRTSCVHTVLTKSKLVIVKIHHTQACVRQR